MKDDYIVRADFYPNGEVIPLGITDNYGRSFYVTRIIQIQRIGINEIAIECIIDSKHYILSLKNNIWNCKEK